ncbi:MAG: DUF6265 family protein [Pyrinomonadaceae bacterium]
MKHKHTFQTLLMIALALTLTLIGNSRTASAAWTISDLGWMAGGWQTDSAGRAVSEEHWTRPAAGSMIGMSRTRVGDRTVSYEFLRLEERGEAIYYVASPKGRCPATDFKLTRLSGQEAVFENPQHDFPKRIIYRKNSDGGLTAIVDAGEGTKSEKFEFKAMTK